MNAVKAYEHLRAGAISRVFRVLLAGFQARVKGQSAVLATAGAVIGSQLAFYSLPLTFQPIVGSCAVYILAGALLWSALPRLPALLTRRQFAAGLGALLGLCTAYLSHADYASVSEAGPVRLSGRVIAPVEQTKFGGIRFRLSVRNRLYLLSTGDLPWKEPEQLRPEMRVELSARLKPLGGSPIFAYDGYLERRGFAAYGYAKDLQVVDDAQAVREPRWTFVEGLYRQFGASEALDVLLGATVGVKDVLGQRILDCFRRLGVTHLLVVSGFHIAIVFAGVLAIARWLCTRSETLMLLVSSRRAASVAALGAVLLGIAVVGAEQPVTRSLVVFAIFTVGQFSGRRPCSFRVYVVSLAALHLIWPAAICEVGFQLTYLSVLGLFCASVWNKALQRTPSDSERLIEMLRAVDPEAFAPADRQLLRRGCCLLRTVVLYSFGAWILTTPVVVHVFGIFSPAGILVNVLVGALFTWCFIVAGGIGLLAQYLGLPGGTLLVQLCLAVGDQVLRVIYWLDVRLSALHLGAIVITPDTQFLASAASTASAFTFLCGTLAVYGRSTQSQRSPGVELEAR